MVNEGYWTLFPAKESAPPTQTPIVNAEGLIKSIKISYLSDTEVIIKYGNKEIRASCKDMNLKATSKTWAMFIKIYETQRMNIMLEYTTK